MIRKPNIALLSFKTRRESAYNPSHFGPVRANHGGIPYLFEARIMQLYLAKYLKS